MAQADVSERMRESSSQGFRCTRCFRDGNLNHTHRDGRPLGAEDICAGCQEPICDRHASLESVGVGATDSHVDVMVHPPAS